MRTAWRIAQTLGLVAAFALIGGWANVNPSGDIQAYNPSGSSGSGSGNPNGPAAGNVDWLGFYQTSSTGPVTILAPNGVGLSVVGNANITGNLAVNGSTTHVGSATFSGLTDNGNFTLNGNATLSAGSRLVLNPNYALYPSSIDFGTDATGGTTGTQAIVMGPVNPNSVPGPNSIQIGSGSQILAGGDRNVCVGAKCFIYSGLRSTALGSNAACASDRCVAIGFNAGNASVGAGQFSVAIGNNSTSYGTSSVSVGATAACGTNGGGQTLATCVGSNTANPNSYSTAVGQGATVTADHQVMIGTAAETVVHPGPTTLNGVVNNGNQIVGQNANNYLQFGATTKIFSPADGTLQLVTSTGTFGTLLLGAAGATTGIKLSAANGALNLNPGDSSTGTATLNINVLTGQTAMSTSGQTNHGELEVRRSSSDSLRLRSTVHGRLSSDSLFGWASGDSGSVARDTTMYRSAAGVVGVNAGSGSTATGAMTLSYVLLGGCKVSSGAGSPESSVVGSPCDLYLSTAGTLYVKQTGAASNTGWIAK